MPDPVPCRSCGKLIVFVPSAAGSPMPLNAEPHPEGNIVIRDAVAVVVNKDLFSQTDEVRYLSHFADCPNAKKHRKARK